MAFADRAQSSSRNVGPIITFGSCAAAVLLNIASRCVARMGLKPRFRPRQARPLPSTPPRRRNSAPALVRVERKKLPPGNPERARQLSSSVLTVPRRISLRQHLIPLFETPDGWKAILVRFNLWHYLPGNPILRGEMEH